MKFKLKEDWLHESEFLGQKTTKKLYEKGHIFEPQDGLYKIISYTGEIFELKEDEMRKFDILEELIENDNEFEIVIEEIPENDDNLIRSWRIQLDVKTTRKKLKEFEIKFRESVEGLK
jgi:hypothetical protein